MAATQKEQLKVYKNRLELSKRWRRDYEGTWKRMAEMYRGKQFEHGSKNDQIAVNISKATVDIIATSVSVNDPQISVNARLEENHPKAIITEAVMDYWFSAEHLSFTPEIQLAVRDSLVYGHGWVKTGWTLGEEERELGPDEMDEAFAEQAQLMDAYAQQNPEMAAQLPTDEEIYMGLPTTVPEVVVDQPFVERVSPFDVFVDPEATSMRNAKWIAQKIVMPLQEAKDNELWDATARGKLNGEVGFPDAWMDNRDKMAKESDVQRVTVWEFYDLKNHTLAVFSEGGDRFLVKPMPFPYKFGQPFVMLRDYDVPDQFYPMGELEAIEPLQDELNKTREQLMAARAQYIRKVFYRQEALGKDGRAALESDQEQFVPVVPGQWQLTDVAYPAPVPPIPADLFDYSSEIIQNMDLVTATSEYDRGGAAQEIRRTATEAAMIQDRSNSRSADRLAKVEKFIGQIGANLACLARQFMSTEQVARVAGVNAMPIWVPYDQETFNYDADFEIVGGSTAPKNEVYKVQQVSLMLQNLGPFIEQGIIDPVAVARHALEAYGVRNPDKFIMPPPPPQEVGPDGQPLEGAPPGAPPPGGPLADQIADPNSQPPGGTQAPAGGIPPQILAQLVGQVGLPTA